jgi:pimeloyl-ACP methyl ester carboxylesterase
MLHYRLEGTGAIPLLLIHGWGVTYSIWENLAPLLTPYFRLIMIELPGIGGSPEADPQKPYYESCAEAIDEVRSALGVEQWSLLAYSSGTRAAEAYVRRYPQTVTRAVFLCPVYLQEIWSLCLRLLDTPHPQTLNEWFLSDWRLYNLICALGFNWHRHDYTSIWQNEIELQPVDILIRSLAEIPGKGRAPFDLPAVPTLFVWGRRDAITAKPRRPRPNDILIPANHSAPVLAAAEVAAAVLPFLTTGELCSTGQGQALSLRESKGLDLSLGASSPYAVWRIWRTMLYKQKKKSTRSRREIRLMSRLRINRRKNVDEAEEARGTRKQYHLLGQRKKKVRSTTHATKRRFLLGQNRDSRSSQTSQKHHFFRRLGKPTETNKIV